MKLFLFLSALICLVVCSSSMLAAAEYSQYRLTYEVPQEVRDFFSLRKAGDTGKTLSAARKLYAHSVNETGDHSFESRFALEWTIEALIASGQTEEASTMKAKLPQKKEEAIIFGSEAVDILRAYGYTCLELAAFVQGKQLLQRAVLICSRPNGPEKIVVAETISQLGDLLIASGAEKEGIKYLQMAADLAKKVPDHSYRASNLMFTLGKGFLAIDQFDRAVETFASFASFLSGQFTADDVRIAQVYIRTGDVLAEAGQLNAALRFYKKAYRHLKTINRDKGPEALNVLHTMGTVSTNLGQFSAAARIFHKAIAIVANLNGTAVHPSALPHLRGLEHIYKEKGMEEKLSNVQAKIQKLEKN